MTRERLVALLTDLVSHRHLTVAEARLILASYDAGEPLDVAQLSALTTTEDDWREAWLLLLLLLGAPTGARWLTVQRQRAQRQLRTTFRATLTGWAAAVVSRQQPVRQWMPRMMTALGQYTRQMAVAGAGQLPAPTVRAAVDQRIEAQRRYVERFGVQLAARQKVDRPMGKLEVAQRSTLYDKVGWGAYFFAQGAEATYGYVEQWLTRDDPHVCPRCRPRHGRYFLPGVGPMPGWDCLGSCRCRRVLVYNEEEYARLQSEPRE